MRDYLIADEFRVNSSSPRWETATGPSELTAPAPATPTTSSPATSSTAPAASPEAAGHESNVESDVFASNSPEPSVPARHRTRLQSGITKPKKFFDGIIRYGMFSSTGEPDSLQEALEDPTWKKAMQDEYDALLRNGTWRLVPQKQGTNIIDCKWVYKIKKKADGSIDRYKARLVAKGFKQRYGIDYERLPHHHDRLPSSSKFILDFAHLVEVGFGGHATLLDVGELHA